MTWPQSMLMVTPDFFNIEYSINPHMLDESGNLNTVDTEKAQRQWQQLKDIFANTGMKVETLSGVQGLPDMVFCANQTFPFIKDDKKSFILSRMGSEQRQPEVQYFKAWAQKKGIEIFEIENSPFEGMGDALWNYETGEVFAGYGFRTSPAAYSEIEKIVGKKFITLELINENFYHLDTCLAILNKDTAAYVPEAFTTEGLHTLKKYIANLIEVPLTEATKNLACNMCCVNGKDIVIQTGAMETIGKLRFSGFTVHETETSEFIKSGGSVFCMKQLLF